MHDDCNYEKQAESDYDKLHSLREVEPSSKVIRLRRSRPAWPWPRIKGFCEALLLKYKKLADPGLQANVPEALQFAQNQSIQ